MPEDESQRIREAQAQAEVSALYRRGPREVPSAEPSQTGHERARLPEPHDPANPGGDQ
jgi:hypothetical protein